MAHGMLVAGMISTVLGTSFQGRILFHSSVKTGDTIKFMNDDNISHNVLSKGPGGNKNAGLQKAGDATAITYDKAGDYEVVCGIHPKMKLTVRVR